MKEILYYKTYKKCKWCGRIYRLDHESDNGLCPKCYKRVILGLKTK